MTLLNAPEYDSRRANRIRNVLIGIAVLIFLFIVLTLAGYMTGHGWLFSNLGAEHEVDRFFTALEAKDYAKAYGIYYNDPDWQKHPEKYSGYPLERFTEDWTTYSPVNGPITSHKVYISRTDGSGTFGSGIIVATQLNNSPKCAFVYVVRSDHTIVWPSPRHEILYDKCHNTE